MIIRAIGGHCAKSFHFIRHTFLPSLTRHTLFRHWSNFHLGCISEPSLIFSAIHA